MLSDLGCSTLSFGIPIPSAPHLEQDPLTPLDFDDLLDIAREFEFTHTITHIWPCEAESDAYHEPQLDDILAAIVSTPNTEESPIPLPSSPLSTTVNPVHVPEPVCPIPDAKTCISPDQALLPKCDDQVQPETRALTESILWGWTPPNGSRFLDLDDSLVFPQLAKNGPISPWLAAFFTTPSAQPAGNINRPSSTTSAIGDVQPQTPATVLKPPRASTADNTADNPRKGGEPTPARLSTRAIPELVQAWSAAQTSSRLPSQTLATSHMRTSRSRQHPPAPTTGSISTVNHVRAPRGGIPPHIARSVTKANIFRIEKERKAMQDVFSSAATKKARKPSVLRRATKADKETSKLADGGGSGKKLFDGGEGDEKEGRAAKRARF